MSDALPVAFDYDSLDPGTREFVRRAADETHGLIRKAAGDIVGIGENLRAVKERLPDTLQRDALAGQVAELGEQARAAALKRDEGEYERRVRLNWYSITADLRAGVLKALSRWPCALDAQVFEADDWARLSQARTLARRLLEACDELTPGSGTLIVESVPGPFSGDKKNGAGVDWKE